MELCGASAMIDDAAEPLHRFPVISTSNPEELRHLAATLLGASQIDLKCEGPFHVRVNLVQLNETGLAFGATSCHLTAEQLSADFIRLAIAVKGCATTSVGGRTTDINQRQLAITPSGVSSRAVCAPGHGRLTLRLRREALVQKLTTLLGVRPKGELSFEPAIAADEPYAQGLLRLVFFLSQQLDSTASKLPSAVCLELEQAIQIAALWASRHSFSHALEREEKKPSCAIVNRLEQYIEANWQEAITVERLVAEAGVSARSVFRAFGLARGYSPMAFAKSVRLRHARMALMSGDPSVSVTGTAFKCNFASPGHFARDYRNAFGELPSQTLSRARR
jgi:AraC-like DNA-binding protein